MFQQNRNLNFTRGRIGRANVRTLGIGPTLALVVLLLGSLSSLYRAQDGKREARESGATKAYRIGGGVSAPRLLEKTEPVYTEAARAQGLEGAVILAIVVDAGGSATDLRVVRGLGFGLDEKAVLAVSQWRFMPGSFEGKAVPVVATVEVHFRLSRTTVPLALGRTVAQPLSCPSEVQHFTINIRSGYFASVTVKRNETLAAIQVLGPSQREVMTVWLPGKYHGFDDVSFVAAETGQYLIVVS